MYTSILHASVIIKDLQTSLNFYQAILGLEIDEKRPEMSYDGAWLWVGQQQIHLLCVPNPDPVTNRPVHGGRDRHVAIGVCDFDKLIKTLELNNINYTLSKSGRLALFCRDPDGNTLEFIHSAITQA